jgi:hypothetical protein
MHLTLVISKAPCLKQLSSILFSKKRINLTKNLLTTPNKITIIILWFKEESSLYSVRKTKLNLETELQ